MAPNRIFILLGTLSLGLLPVFATGFDYCTKTCDDDEHPHTMCETKYPEGGGSNCTEYTFGLTASEKQLLMDTHNALRQKLATGGEKSFPTASNMMVMGWGKETAMIAQRWAEQCDYRVHDKCRDTINQDSGQNLAGGTYFVAQGVNLTGMVHAWYSEISDYSAPETPDTFTYTPGIGHFTQLCWASTYAMGCGIRRTYNKPVGKFWLVCNYTPAGNLIGGSLYKSGKPCSACPKGSHCSKKWAGLCTYNKKDK